MGPTLSELREIAVDSKRNVPVDCSIKSNVDSLASSGFREVAYRITILGPYGTIAERLGITGWEREKSVPRYRRIIAALRARFGERPLCLDAGCGTGRNVSEANLNTDAAHFGADMRHYARWYAASAPSVIPPELYDALASHRRGLNAYTHAPDDNFILTDATHMSVIPDCSFHFVDSQGVAQYVPEPRLLEAIHRVLKPGGIGVVTLGHSDIYTAYGTTREREFARMNAAGHCIDLTPGYRAYAVIEKKKEGSLEFPAQLTGSRAAELFTIRYHA